MISNDRTACISPVRLNNKSKFNFECHSKIECFTFCCRDIKITLTPYDILELKNRLELSSRDFLAIYTKPYLLDKTDLPMVTLKSLDDNEKSCPFMKCSEGCIIYENRPTACRYYPLGVATMQYKEDLKDGNFYFFVNEPHCKGFAEKKMWSVEKWRKNQGVEVRDFLNMEWANLLVQKRSFPSNIKLNEQAKQMFFLVSYDIDKFKEFVFNTSFLKRFSVSDKKKKEIVDSEVELLKFGLNWLKDIIFSNKQHAKM